MPRRRRPLVREDALRDASLIVIATEDSKATPTYLRNLVSPPYYSSTRFHVEIIPHDNTASAPSHVLSRLKKWQTEYELGDDDQLWLVIDVDNWQEQMLGETAQKCVQSGIALAVSNPAIELWFLLHLDDPVNWDADKRKALLANKKISQNRTQLEMEIVQITGRYNKNNLNSSDFLPNVQLAIERAEQLDSASSDRWPQSLGTHIYRLVNVIKEYASRK